jgi:hypothetical protein
LIVPEILESVFWVKPGLCGRFRNSGIGDLRQTEIVWSFQKFWNRCFGSNRDSVVVPEVLESVVWVKSRFFDRSRNSGIGGLGQSEILWQFQKFWNRCSRSNRDFVVVLEILESVVWVKPRFFDRSRNSGIGGLGQTEIL